MYEKKTSAGSIFHDNKIFVIIKNEMKQPQTLQLRREREEKNMNMDRNKYLRAFYDYKVM